MEQLKADLIYERKEKDRMVNKLVQQLAAERQPWASGTKITKLACKQRLPTNSKWHSVRTDSDREDKLGAIHMPWRKVKEFVNPSTSPTTPARRGSTEATSGALQAVRPLLVTAVGIGRDFALEKSTLRWLSAGDQMKYLKRPLWFFVVFVFTYG